MREDDPAIDFAAHELYHQYFPKCAELALIAKPFELAAAGQEAAERDLEAEFELVRALTETKKHKLKLRVNSILENKKNRYPEQSICAFPPMQTSTVASDWKTPRARDTSTPTGCRCRQGR
jgi:hypothetical protein